MRHDGPGDEAVGPPPGVTVRYWAGAREAAGCVEETVSPAPLRALLDSLADRHGGRLRQVIDHSLVLVNGARMGRDEPTAVTAGALVEVLPPFAGG